MFTGSRSPKNAGNSLQDVMQELTARFENNLLGEELGSLVCCTESTSHDVAVVTTMMSCPPDFAHEVVDCMTNVMRSVAEKHGSSITHIVESTLGSGDTADNPAATRL